MENCFRNNRKCDLSPDHLIKSNSSFFDSCRSFHPVYVSQLIPFDIKVIVSHRRL